MTLHATGETRTARIGTVLVRAASVLLLVAATSGCGDAGAVRPVDAAGLSGAYPSREALGRAVLRGLEADSRDSLEALLVTRAEHRELLWPQLPERNYLTFERARLLTVRNTREGMQRALGRYGGRSFVLVRLEMSGDTEAYDGFTLHRGVRLVARDPDSGREGELEILDVLLERRGHWKLLNYEE